MHPCTNLNHLLLIHSFSLNFLFFCLPLSIFRVQQWCPWPPNTMLFLIWDPLIISFVTIIFFVLMLRSLSLWILPTVALWRFWELVMLNSGVLFMTVLYPVWVSLHSWCTYQPPFSWYPCWVWFVLFVYFLLAALQKFFIPKVILNSLVLPFQLLWITFLFLIPPANVVMSPIYRTHSYMGDKGNAKLSSISHDGMW